ncbi:MAG: DUF3016 domain-containing protein [Alphaproteobacteria bacterium]
MVKDTRMRFSKQAPGALISGCIFASPAFSAVTITFSHPESYSDPGLRGGFGIMSREVVLAELRQHLAVLGSRYLPGNRSLEIEVIDLRWAGHVELRHILLREARIMHPSTWPMIKLRYRLHENGATLATAGETLRDLDYLTRVRTCASAELLRFEKAMLDDWFRERFAIAGR